MLCIVIEYETASVRIVLVYTESISRIGFILTVKICQLLSGNLCYVDGCSAGIDL